MHRITHRRGTNLFLFCSQELFKISSEASKGLFYYQLIQINREERKVFSAALILLFCLRNISITSKNTKLLIGLFFTLNNVSCWWTDSVWKKIVKEVKFFLCPLTYWQRFCTLVHRLWLVLRRFRRVGSVSASRQQPDREEPQNLLIKY